MGLCVKAKGPQDVVVRVYWEGQGVKSALDSC